MFNCVTDVTEFELGLLRACWFIPILLCSSSSQPILGDLAELLTLGPFLPLWCLIHRHRGIKYLHLPQTRLFQRIFFSLFVLLLPRVLLCCWATDVLTVSVDAFPPWSAQHKFCIPSISIPFFIYQPTVLLGFWHCGSFLQLPIVLDFTILEICALSQRILSYFCISVPLLFHQVVMNLLNGLFFTVDSS